MLTGCENHSIVDWLLVGGIVCGDYSIDVSLLVGEIDEEDHSIVDWL